MLKLLIVWITTNDAKFLKEMGIPDYLTCLLRNLYVCQEATERTRHGTTDWFKIGKGVWQGCILLPCLFNLYAEYIMQNARLDGSQAGIKIVRRNINNFSYDKPRQHIKNQRLHFVDQGLYSQIYYFSNSHIWMCFGP